jgi:hypothetical protein
VCRCRSNLIDVARCKLRLIFTRFNDGLGGHSLFVRRWPWIRKPTTDGMVGIGGHSAHSPRFGSPEHLGSEQNLASSHLIDDDDNHLSTTIFQSLKRQSDALKLRMEMRNVIPSEDLRILYFQARFRSRFPCNGGA